MALNRFPSKTDTLVELIARQDSAMGIEDIAQCLSEPIARRTLQRHLSGLVEEGRLLRIGAARAVKYLRAPRLPYGGVTPALLDNGERDAIPMHVSLSPESNDILAYVRKPLASRLPVGYQIGFLEQYHPNHTFYLSQQLRDQLHTMGRSPAQQQPAGTFARDILGSLLIDLSWASSKLEGNTYSRLDTEKLIRFGEMAESKDAFEAQMILNHKDAIEYLVQEPQPTTVNTDTIYAIHAILSYGLMQDPSSCGRIRNHAVGISGSVYLPLVMPQQIEELFGVVIQMASEIRDPFEQSFFLMVHLPYLQPFEDVNKRVSRIAANIPLIRDNLSPLSFIDVSQQLYADGLFGVYELNRVELLRDVYVDAYARSCQQYVAIKHSLVPPDVFRLRYRRELIDIVGVIVRDNLPPTADAIRRVTPDRVTEADIAHFVELVLGDLNSLHSGNAIRFGIRPLELATWKKAHAT